MFSVIVPISAVKLRESAWKSTTDIEIHFSESDNADPGQKSTYADDSPPAAFRKYTNRCA